MHVWLADLNQEPAVVRALREILTPDERQRADKFYFEKDRLHFIVARGALREILGSYLDIPPERISFSYSEYGKPALVGNAKESRLRFNVSHSHGVARYAVTSGREVGIDLELIRHDFAGLDIAQRYFSPEEVSALRALPHEQQTAAFFNCWTRKEAYIKARGEGLTYPLHRFTVPLAPGEPAALLMTNDAPSEAAQWPLMELPLSAGYATALAVKSSAPYMTFSQWLKDKYV